MKTIITLISLCLLLLTGCVTTVGIKGIPDMADPEEHPGYATIQAETRF